MVDLLRLLLHSMIAMTEDLMSDTPLTLLPPVVEPELLRGFAMTTTEPHRLGILFAFKENSSEFCF
jgi:hypothetical protein